MTANKATPEGTRKYAQRFAGKAAEGHFRLAQRLSVSSIGIGTYLGQPNTATDEGYTASVMEAVKSGLNFIDAAINYRFQRSERSIGAALKRLAAEGYSRDELAICTKGGYLTPDGAMPADANEYFFREYIQPGIFGAKDIVAGSHCMSPGFLRDQIRRSLENLGVECIDVYYLHNPETQLAEIPKSEFLNRVREAFAALEEMAGAGSIQYYGMATWNGFRREATAQDGMQLAEIARIAQEVAGGTHRFRFVQFPFNLGMTEALTLGNQSAGGKARTLMETANELEIALVGSASLLQGELTRNLPPFVGEALGMETDGERALQFARSAPGITTALAGMSRVEHVRANARLAGVPPAKAEEFTALFKRGED